MVRILALFFGLLPTLLQAQSLQWKYLKLNEVPEPSVKQQLQEAGIKLHQYKPDLIWLASVPSNISNEKLQELGVSKTFTPRLIEKVDPRIYHGQIPEYAQSDVGVSALFTLATVSDYTEFNLRLTEKEVAVLSVFEPLGIAQVTGTADAILAAASLPFVIYAELPNPPAELEIEDEMTMTRAPYINGYYNLNSVTGDGITIAVNEGGRMDSLYDPDYKNRLNRTWESGGTSGHKTGVGMRMCSAGNLDPEQCGQAWGATLWSGGVNFTNAAQANVNIVNNSFGYGCISGTVTYNAGAALNDYLVRTNSRFMITYSCGNIGGSNCASYGAGAGWGSITGLVKSAKNIFAVGAMNPDDQLTGFSSRGPAMDGRILPDITATGPGGTSFASPNLAGVNALLTEAYRNENSNQWPQSGLIKAIILNTADDMENPGPDFRTGFGRINAKRGFEVIENNQHLQDSIANAAVKTHTINVPSGVRMVKVSLYWTDHEATAGITGKTLVNNLDLRVQEPAGTWHLPWVLNTFPQNDSLILPATPGVDTLNNVELVTLVNPTAGNHTVEVTGTLIPFGPQTYHVVYSFVYDSIEVVYPRGGEGLVSGETRRIRWDDFDTGSPYSISFSPDSGATWQSVATGIASNLRTFTWLVPAVKSGKCLVSIQSGSRSDTSEVFTIATVPGNISLIWRCADSAMISWDSVPGALGYRVYRLGNKYMDTATFTSNAYTKLYNLSFTQSEWISVQTVLPDSGSGRRAVAIEIPPGNFNCIGTDLAAVELLSPNPGYYASCISSAPLPVQLRVQNTGTSGLTNLPVAFRLNNGNIQRDTAFISLGSPASALLQFSDSVTLQTGINTLKVWADYPNDANAANDTLTVSITRYSSNSVVIPFSQSFDSFTGCSTAWGCGTVTCALSQGWYNIPNNPQGDSIDWRTHSGATGTGGTGPSGDHTSGSGNYLYLEGSGNGGSGCQNSVAMLHSPCIDLTLANNPQLSYWYHAFGGAIGSLHVDVLADGIWHEDVATPVVGAQGNQWLQQSVSLSAFQGEKITLRFRGITGSGWAADLALDDINLSTLPNVNFATSTDSFCLGQTVPLQNLTAFATGYSWNVVQSTYGYAAGNSSSTNPVILPTDTGWYDVELVATNGTGSDTLLIHNLFYVGSFSSPMLVSNGMNDVFCNGDTAVFTASGPGSTFTFFFNGNSVQNGNSATWSTGAFTSGDSVWVTNSINTTCVNSSTKKYLTLRPDLNGSSLTASDADLSICSGDSIVFTAVSGMSTYSFLINGNQIASNTTGIYTTSSLAHGDAVSCEVTDSFSCSGVTDTLVWTVIDLPQTPVISFISPDSLNASTPASSYAWRKDGSLLSANTQTIQAQGNGLYTVKAVEAGCASGESNPFEYILFGMDAPEDSGIRIYPNPTQELFTVEVDPAVYRSIFLYDGTGKEVYRESLQQTVNEIKLPPLAKGLYIVHISGTNRNVKTLLGIQ